MPAFESVALIGRQDGPRSAALVSDLARFLAARGCDVVVEKATAEQIGRAHV